MPEKHNEPVKPLHPTPPLFGSSVLQFFGSVLRFPSSILYPPPADPSSIFHPRLAGRRALFSIFYPPSSVPRPPFSSPFPPLLPFPPSIPFTPLNPPVILQILKTFKTFKKTALIFYDREQNTHFSQNFWNMQNFQNFHKNRSHFLRS